MKNKMFTAEKISYTILFVVFALSVVLRLVATSGSSVIPGIGSMYYPLQVRCLLERGSLGYPDMPLVFRLEALVAKLLILFTSLPVDVAIVAACRWVSAVVPSLIVLPVFFLARSVSGRTFPPFYLAVILALSVLNPSVLVLFAIDFDKNAIGMLFVYLTLYYVWEYVRSGRTRHIRLAALSVLLTLFTHFGCFTALFAFLILLALTSGVYHARRLRSWFMASKIRLVVGLYLLIALVLLPVAIKLFDPQRYDHLARYIGAPLDFFRNSLFLEMVKGKFSWDWPNMLYLVVINSFSVGSVIAWFRLRKRLGNAESAFFLSLVLWFVLLSNPFINTAIYRRLLFISLIPMSVVIIFVLHYFRKPVKVTLSVILSLLLLLTVVTSGVRKTFISPEENAELKQVRRHIARPSTTIVLAQHRLEFWTSWTLRMKSGQLSGLKPEEYANYSQVLYLVQKSNAPYQEPLPAGAARIYEGKYFELYRLR
ncbi:MAG TPA: hypothetical protein PLK82_08155 [Bacteroidales bacterium]|nr:hypothetical protein [Bacteroidales bacterium]